MKRSRGIVVLVLVVLGFLLSPSSYTAEDISKDIAAFRTQFQSALDTIHKAQPGQTLNMTTLSISIKNMEKILDSTKKRINAEQKKIDVKLNKAEEAVLRAMMRNVKKEQEDTEKKKNEKEEETKREHLAKIEKLVKEMVKIHEKTKSQTGQFY
jgi:seryl-tRNA synthetase